MTDAGIKKKIIIAPLDWGLGHATRCIPIIRTCIEKNYEVILISSGRSFELLKREFPEQQCINLHAYNIYYQKNGSFIIKVLSQFGKIFFGIRREHKALNEIVNTEHIGLVISDNRYGMWNKNVKSILITHQMMIKVPQFKIAEYFVYLWLKRQNRKFDEIWIPDVAGDINLSGDLSHKYPAQKNTKYIGILTRFSKPEVMPPIEFDIMVIISGPEPQRSIFEEIIIKQTKQTHLKVVIIRGVSEKNEDVWLTDTIRLISHLPSHDLFQLITKSNTIISRGGYSTLMDLVSLNKKCIFVPTPGQTEQEYLVKELHRKKLAYGVEQKDFNLVNALEELNAFSVFSLQTNLEAYKTTVLKSLP